MANAGADQKITLGTETTLDGQGSSDPDHGLQPATYSWRLVAKLTGSQVTDADLVGSETATLKFLPDVRNNL